MHFFMLILKFSKATDFDFFLVGRSSENLLTYFLTYITEKPSTFLLALKF